jgi:hypothetical protein
MGETMDDSNYEFQDEEEEDEYEEQQDEIPRAPLATPKRATDQRHLPFDPNRSSPGTDQESTPNTGATPKIKLHAPVRLPQESLPYKKTHKYRKLVDEGKAPKTRVDPDWVIGGQHKDKPPRTPEESRLPTSAPGESERVREAERKLAKREKRERLKAKNAQKEADLDAAIGPFSPKGTKQPRSPTSRKSTKASKKSTPASVTTGAKSHSLRDSQCSTTANESEEASTTSHLPK